MLTDSVWRYSVLGTLYKTVISQKATGAILQSYILNYQRKHNSVDIHKRHKMIQQDWNRSTGTEVSANTNRERAETATVKPGGWIHWEKGIKPDKEWQYMIPKDTAHNKALNSYPPDHSINIQFSRSVVSNSLWPHGLYIPWNSPGQNTGVCSLSLFQGIFPTQVSHTAGRFFTT